MTDNFNPNNSSSEFKNILENDYLNLNNTLKGIFRRKKYFFTFGLGTFLIVIIVTFLNRLIDPVYMGSFTLLISDPLSVKEKKPYKPDEEELIENVAINDTEVDIPTLIEYLTSSVLIKEIAEKYKYNTPQLISRVNVKTGGKISKNNKEKANGILKVEVLTKKPKKDLALIKDLSTLYLKTSLKQRQKRLKDGLEFLDTQEPILQKKYNDLESKLVDFREKYSLIEPEKEGFSIKIQEKKLKDELSQLTSERNRLLSVKNEVINGTLSATGFEDEISSNNIKGLKIRGYDQSLLKQIFSLENQISENRMIYKEQSSTITNLKNNLNELKPLLKKSQLKVIDTALRLNSAKILNAENKLEKLQKVFLKKPQLIKNYNSLQQKLDISKRNLIGLVSARENFQLQIAQSSVPWKIIEDPFIHKKPIKPSINNGFLFALLSGFFAGLFSAFLRDKNDYVFHDSEEVSELINCKILSSIPYMKIFNEVNDLNKNIFKKFNLEGLDIDDKQKILFDKEKFQFQESLKNLYSYIKFISTKKKTIFLSITSSLSGEGKSLTNIMFSKTLSELGFKVLLIDGDLRKPQIHLWLELDNKEGLSDYILEKNLDLKKIIKKIKGIDNLDIITSGSKVEEPSKILNSSKMKLFLSSISKSDNYDFILIDSPQIMGISDSLLNSEFLDGYILLISLGKTPRDFPLQSIEKIKLSNTPLLGIVTNQLVESNFNKETINMKNNKYLSSEYYSQEETLDNKKINDSKENIIIKDDSDINNKYNIRLYFVKNLTKLKKKFNLLKSWIEK